MENRAEFTPITQEDLARMANPINFDTDRVKNKVLDVQYGTLSEQKLDIYLPDEVKAPVPVIFYVHGGGWCLGTKRLGARRRRPETVGSRSQVYASLEHPNDRRIGQAFGGRTPRMQELRRYELEGNSRKTGQLQRQAPRRLIERDGRFSNVGVSWRSEIKASRVIKRPCGGASARDDDSGERSFFSC